MTAEAIMITQDGRESLALQSLEGYLRQIYQNRRIHIIVQNEKLHSFYSNHTERWSNARVTLASDHLTLGELRNLAIDMALPGSVVIQWDDDDLHRSDRMETQMEPFADEAVLATFLGAQIVEVNQVRYVWSNPRGVEGTIAHRAEIPHRYRSLRRAEDTVFRDSLPRDAVKILSNDPDMYVYRYHGSNTWGLDDFMRLVRTAKKTSAQLPLSTAILT